MNKVLSNTGAIIVAAGRSQRMGGKDKNFVLLGSKPLLTWTVDTCQSCQLIQQIVIVLSEKNLELGQKLAMERGWSKVVKVAVGGKRRQDSVKEGLKLLTNCEWVVIQDGARPFLTLALIEDGLKAAAKTGAAATAVPVKDTIKLAGEDRSVRQTLNRRQLWAVQTPQIFRFDIITRAYEQVVGETTDDATLVEQMGYKVKLYMGAYDNIKVTTPEDLALAEIIARSFINTRRDRPCSARL